MSDEAQRAKWREASRKYSEVNRDRRRKASQAYRDRVREDPDAYEALKEKWRQASRNYSATNKDKEDARKRKWRQANLGKARAVNAKRYAAELQAMPEWLTAGDKAMIAAIYEMSARLTQCTGIPHQVDHIVPLRGKNVCGLHVPWNMAVIPASINRRKGNRYPSDQVRYQMSDQ